MGFQNTKLAFCSKLVKKFAKILGNFAVLTKCLFSLFHNLFIFVACENVLALFDEINFHKKKHLY